MLYREIIAVCSQIHTKHINTLCGQNVELLNVKLAVHIVTTGLYTVKENHKPHLQFPVCRTGSWFQRRNDVRWIGWHLPVVKATRAPCWRWNSWPARTHTSFQSLQHSVCRNVVLRQSSSLPRHIHVNRNISVFLGQFLKICACQLLLSHSFPWSSLHNLCYSLLLTYIVHRIWQQNSCM